MSATPPKEIIIVPDYNIINKMLPPYDGNSKNLNCYIRCVESVINLYNLKTNDPTLVCLLRAKLSSRALEALSLEIDISDWISIKTALMNRYGEFRSEVQLLQELTRCTKTKTDTCDSYGRRIRDLLDALCSIGTNKNGYYQSLAINTYIDNLHYNMGLGVRIKNPITLEAAIAYARQEETRFHNPNNYSVQQPTSNRPITNEFHRPNNYQRYHGPNTSNNRNFNNTQFPQKRYPPIEYKPYMQSNQNPEMKPTHNTDKNNSLVPVKRERIYQIQSNTNEPQTSYHETTNLTDPHNNTDPIQVYDESPINFPLEENHPPFT